jgi:hypothetical protein
MNRTSSIITLKKVNDRMHTLRGQRIVLDGDIADIFGVPKSVLRKYVRRQIRRFPADFMFLLTREEIRNIGLHLNWGTTKSLPMAFTLEGVIMLSCVLKSRQAVNLSVVIMQIITDLGSGPYWGPDKAVA